MPCAVSEAHNRTGVEPIGRDPTHAPGSSRPPLPPLTPGHPLPSSRHDDHDDHHCVVACRALSVPKALNRLASRGINGTRASRRGPGGAVPSPLRLRPRSGPTKRARVEDRRVSGARAVPIARAATPAGRPTGGATLPPPDEATTTLPCTASTTGDLLDCDCGYVSTFMKRQLLEMYDAHTLHVKRWGLSPRGHSGPAWTGAAPMSEARDRLALNRSTDGGALWRDWSHTPAP